MIRSRAILLAGAVLAVGALLSACGGSSDNAKSTTTVTTKVTASTEATTTSDLTTSTTEAASPFPDYAAYLAALPPGTETCNTKGIVTGGGGQYGLGGPDAVLSMVNGEMTIFCPGAGLTVGDPFTGVNQFGDPLAEGDLFSVAAGGTYVQLSSF